MKKIYIENIDDYILVDDEDFERVNFYKWHKSYTHDTQRFLAQILGKKTALPVFILNNQYAYQKVKNNDFTRGNLGADKHSFRYRAPQKNSSSKYKGVSYDSKHNKWVASIYAEGEKKYLGRFVDEKECAKAYNKAVQKYWGGDGYLNDV
ncbi:TPA: AP2 domain-containing protein [Staphylococcus aureus]